MKRIYLDHIACTPLHSDVVEEMLPYLREKFGNPQSLHSVGQHALEAIEEAREKVARLINAEPSEIFFTSSGSEANNFAMKGLALAHQNQGKHIILSSVEHQSILHAAKFLEKMGFSFSLIPVDKHGMVDPEDVRNALTEDTILASVMLANGEVGTLEPVQEIAEICRNREVLLHTDAVDAVGSIPVDIEVLGVDALSLAGHQFYGPKGSAALFLKKGKRILPFIDGGIQERGRRAGNRGCPGHCRDGKSR